MKITTKRLQAWDYSWNAAYFVTINCKSKAEFFGKIIQEKMVLSELGEVAYGIWKIIPKQFPYTRLRTFQIMPDHMHGIIILLKEASTTTEIIEEGKGGFIGESNPMLHDNLSRIIRWYKGRCTYECRKLNPEFKWQSTFDDRILRTSADIKRVEKYIRNNPQNWNPKTK